LIDHLTVADAPYWFRKKYSVAPTDGMQLYRAIPGEKFANTSNATATLERL